MIYRFDKGKWPVHMAQNRVQQDEEVGAISEDV